MNVFEVSDLKYQYFKEKKEAVRGLSFSIKKGEVFGLLGPSGAGKSTTQKVLTKLLPNYKGSVMYLGKELSHYGPSFFEKIGVGFELPVHFNKLTALENMKFFQNLYQSKSEIEPLLEKVGLLEDKDRLVGTFSKGMKMRLNFVRALLNNPDFLFLDEVTNGLDPTNANIIKNIIRDFKNEGKTVLLTTHLMGDVEALCDQVAFIKNGEIIETDTVKNLKLKYGEKNLKVEYIKNKNVVLETFSMENIGSNDAFLKILKDYEIQTIHSGETSLESIFIKITGDTDVA